MFYVYRVNDYTSNLEYQTEDPLDAQSYVNECIEAGLGVREDFEVGGEI